ncbi:MAG: hypothetical protein IJX08_09380 [Clostridia bacterium]|nr:hypothetical protein [Clostridia bacterium]
MRKYTILPENHFYRLSDQVQGEALTVKDGEKTVYLIPTEYPQKVYEEILDRASSYRVVEESFLETGRGTEDKGSDLLKIDPNSIIVQDDLFAGVLTLCGYEQEVYMHRDNIACKEYQGILFADGNSMGINQDMYSQLPGCWRFISRYSLKKTEYARVLFMGIRL